MATKQAVILLEHADARPIVEPELLDQTLFHVARQGYDDLLLPSVDPAYAARWQGRTLRSAKVRAICRAGETGLIATLRAARDLLDPTFLLIRGDRPAGMNFRRLDAALSGAPDALGALALRQAAPHDDLFCLRRSRIVCKAETGVAADAAMPSFGADAGVLRREALDSVSGSTPSALLAELAAGGKLVGAIYDFLFPLEGPRPALFLDRDGVLNHDSGYTHRPEDLEWIPGAIEVVRRANDMGALVIVVTNQSGIGLGYYGEAEVARFHATMREELYAAGAFIDAFYHCPHHPEATVEEWRHPDPPDRKPNPGMILKALAEWPIDVSKSFMIGDRDSDVEAAARAGLRSLLFKGGDLRVAAETAFAAMTGALDE